MSLSLSISPVYPAFGEPVTLVGESSLAADDAVQWELTSVPSKSALAAGLLVTPAPKVARTKNTPMSFVARSTQRGHRASITRSSGSFVAEGYLPGMALTISGSASNDSLVTISAVEAQRLVLGPNDVLTAESASVTLTGTLNDPDRTPSNTFVPDVAGEYGFTAMEYLPLDMGPAGQSLKLVSTSTLTVHVGGYLDLPIEPVNGHASTLRILVVNETVRGAALIEPRTELARVAALDTTVAASVTALVGVAVGSLDAEFIETVNLGCAAYEAHRILTGGGPVHGSADTTNVLLREFAWSVPTAIARLNDWSDKLRKHMESGTSGSTHHDEDDTRNTLQVAPTAKALGEATVLLADLRNRVYARHIAQVDDPDSHRTADVTNTVTATALGKVSYAVVQFLDYVAGGVSAATGESEGVADAQAMWGFRAV